MKYCIFIVSLFLCLMAEAQQKPVTAQPAAAGAVAGSPAQPVPLSLEQIDELQGDIMEYMEEVSGLSSQISESDEAQLKQLRRELQAIDARWQAFSALEQTDIASTPELLDLLSQYKQVYLAVDDSITAQMACATAKVTFAKAASFIDKCQSQYKTLLSQAQEYSLVPQTAAQLGKVKAQEQILMQQITAQYTQATNAANALPDLKGQLATLEQKYIAIQEMSKKIQAAAYKSFIERIKDYLLSFAAVAIIIMFITMASSKIAAMKKAREMAKKYGNMLNGRPDDTPTI